MITANIVTYFKMIPDPRIVRCTHCMTDVVAIALLAKICDADGWEDMHESDCAGFLRCNRTPFARHCTIF